MKYGKVSFILLTLFLTVLGTIFLSNKSFAQQGGYDVTVSPVFLDFATKPGNTISDKIRIRNNTTKDMQLKIVVQKLTGDVNGDITLRIAKDDSTLSWIKFNNQVITAKALEWTEVPIRIEVPQSAAFGYYFGITFQEDSNLEEGQTGAKLSGAVVVPILLNVQKPGAKSEAKIADFKTTQGVYEYLPADFAVKIQNTGNIHIKPHGNIFIRNGDKDLAILEVNQAGGNVLPQTIRSFESSWNDGFLVIEPVVEFGEIKKDKQGNVVKHLKINWDKLTNFRIGKYTANLLMVYDDGKKDQVLEATTTFWVFPYKAVGITIIVLIILFTVVQFLLKSYINREVKKRSN